MALSGNGQVALVTAPGAPDFPGTGATYVYQETGGTWSTDPVATFPISGGAAALSGNGQVALISYSGIDALNGSVWLYQVPSGAVAQFFGGYDEVFGFSVALSADGQRAWWGPGWGLS